MDEVTCFVVSAAAELFLDFHRERLMQVEETNYLRGHTRHRCLRGYRQAGILALLIPQTSTQPRPASPHAAAARTSITHLPRLTILRWCWGRYRWRHLASSAVKCV
ncbi:hypothetical protein E2C01_095771 [Portunus trituberculatus]|uniref:Uncharacterized protein n=1 Tax=Portunus trituberculatus TaxID=210409 RepID=A0A5B7K4W3_PORTR|nr:hypothetical protein [Portunus trituberculatus]